MQDTTTDSFRSARPIALAVLLLGSVQSHALDVYDPSNRQLTIPSLQIGSATYTNVVVNIGSIVSGPAGSSPNGADDTYNPGLNQLTVPAVAVGSSNYYNVVATVAGLVSLGSVTGADTYDGTTLNIPQVQVGGSVYANVAVMEATGNIIRVAGGMPTAGPDTYNAVTNELAIPAVQVGGHAYTNVVVSAGKVQGIGGVAFMNQESVLYSFGSNADALSPGTGVILGADGNFYGTSADGGAYGNGTVFKVTPAGGETVLHSFARTTTDGGTPGPLVLGSNGNLYGATQFGGASASGTFYRITPSGMETVLYSFGQGSTDASAPSGAPILGSDGNFYGTTSSGGNNGTGTIYRITPSGTESVVYSFAVPTLLGPYPYGVIQGSDGSFYGTTFNGSPTNQGTVFKVTPEGVLSWVYNFKGAPSDGGQGTDGLLLQGSDGNFYGTTRSGGANDVGTVFRISPDGVESLLYSFGSDITDGTIPSSGLLQGHDGNYYGTTGTGGTNSAGTVFRINAAGTESVLYAFGSGATDGAFPIGTLIQDSAGNLYGTNSPGLTSSPTSSREGTVFSITPTGHESVLYAFQTVADGSNPLTLVQGSDGNFYGSTQYGGQYGYGTVFKITPAGAATLLHSFQGGTADGSDPSGSPVLGSDGNVYGLTITGGANGKGTVYRITPAGIETVLHSFVGGTGDGDSAQGDLIEGTDGNFYGVTASGGPTGAGTVFRITPAGAESLLYSFQGQTGDGRTPRGIFQGADGNFYGATFYGGGAADLGVVFRITPGGAETVLHSFQGGTADGSRPNSVIQAGDGNIYGTASFGGAANDGVLFSINPLTSVETVLYSFGGTISGSASLPYLPFLQGKDGNFYGVSTAGGAYGAGTIFKVTPTGVATVLYSFGAQSADGIAPQGLIEAGDGNFYGTAYSGGLGEGTVFRISTASK